MPLVAMPAGAILHILAPVLCLRSAYPVQARSNLRTLQRLATDEDVHPHFHPITHFSRSGALRRARSAGPSSINARLDFDEFLARQEQHVARKAGHAREQRAERAADVKRGPLLSPGTRRILADKAHREPWVRCSNKYINIAIPTQAQLTRMSGALAPVAQLLTYAWFSVVSTQPQC